MGLDMYLHKKTYIGNQYRDANKQVKVIVPKNQKGVFFPVKIKQERVSEIVETVAYWRKANQIHKWFVDNVQDGEDDCGEYYVSDTKLKELIDVCKEVKSRVILEEGDVVVSYTYKDGQRVADYEKGMVITNPDVIAELLPSQGGFFFGGTEYDEFYLQDVDNTIKQLEPLLDEDGGGDFYYNSSW